MYLVKREKNPKEFEQVRYRNRGADMIEIYLKEHKSDSGAFFMEIKNTEGRRKLRPSEIMISAAVRYTSDIWSMSKEYAALVVLKYVVDYLRHIGVDDEKIHESMDMPENMIICEGVMENADR